MHKLFNLLYNIDDNFSCKVKNLYSTDDGETSEKSHGASYRR